MVFVSIFHLIAVVHFCFAFWYDRIYITEPDAKWRGYDFGGRLSEKKFNQKINFLKFLCICSLFNTLEHSK